MRRRRATTLVAAALAAVLAAGIGLPPALARPRPPHHRLPPTATTAAPPSVTGLSPARGPLEGLVQVAISGSGFTCGQGSSGTTVKVYFGDESATFPMPGEPAGAPQQFTPEVVSDSLLLATAPPSTIAGPVDVTVDITTAPGGPTCGSSQPGATDRFTYLGQCSSSSTTPGAAPCPLEVDTEVTDGPAQAVADGFLHGLVSGEPAVANLVQALEPRYWRLSYLDQLGVDPDAFIKQLSPEPKIIWVLSDGWAEAVGTSIAPWSDLADWDTYVTDMVSGRQWCYPGNGHCIPPPDIGVDYWEPLNEPPGAWASTDPGTPADWMDAMQHAYNAIKSALPTANVIAPAIGAFNDVSWPASGEPNSSDSLGMVDFLEFSAQNNLDWAGISWHELWSAPTDNGQPAPFLDDAPLLMGDHVTRMRRLLRQFPSLGSPMLMVDEYGPPQNFNEPGWAAGEIASMEYAGAAEASRTCYQCGYGLDNLFYNSTNWDASATQPYDLNYDEYVPAPSYWVYQFYGNMGGTRVETSSDYTDLYAFATRDDSTSTIQVLAGRALRSSVCCNGGVDQSPASVDVEVSWPYGGTAADATVDLIPNGQLALAAPIPVLAGALPVSNGVVTIPLPNFADGDAYTITLRALGG